MKPDQLQQFLVGKIPLARALGIRVVQVDSKSAKIAVPLAPNINHMGTAFGGSLNAVLVLACYSWLFNALGERGLEAHVVLKSSSVKYKDPVSADFSATCVAPPAAEVEQFFAVMKRRNRAQINLQAVVDVNGSRACELDGIFVAVPSESR